VLFPYLPVSGKFASVVNGAYHGEKKDKEQWHPQHGVAILIAKDKYIVPGHAFEHGEKKQVKFEQQHQ